MGEQTMVDYGDDTIPVPLYRNDEYQRDRRTLRNLMIKYGDSWILEQLGDYDIIIGFLEDEGYTVLK